MYILKKKMAPCLLCFFKKEHSTTLYNIFNYGVNNFAKKAYLLKVAKCIVVQAFF